MEIVMVSILFFLILSDSFLSLVVPVVTLAATYFATPADRASCQYVVNF